MGEMMVVGVLVRCGDVRRLREVAEVVGVEEDESWWLMLLLLFANRFSRYSTAKLVAGGGPSVESIVMALILPFGGEWSSEGEDEGEVTEGGRGREEGGEKH
jgi:hypothetical protein